MNLTYNFRIQFLNLLGRIKLLFFILFCFLALAFHLQNSTEAQNITTASNQKISDTVGNFTGMVDNNDAFGFSVSQLGLLNGDSVTDIAVGAPFDDDGGNNRGAVWVLFLNQDGTVIAHQKISDTVGNFTGTITSDDQFGSSVTSLGDIDGDSVTDIAVGAPFDDDGGNNRGAVWVLFLNQDGTVKAHQKISDTVGNFTGTLNDVDIFGSSVTSLGDIDGDSVTDIAVGAPFDDDGGDDRGAVWILFLNQDSTVKANQKISDTVGNFTGTLNDIDIFGTSVTSLGDIDGDSVTDIAVGAPFDNGGGDFRGAVWILFLNQDGTVKAHQKISDTVGNFTGTLNDLDFFGTSVTSLGDIDGDSVTDIAVGASFDDDGGDNSGAVWVLFLNQDGTVKANQKISDTTGNFDGTIINDDQFGSSVTSLGDIDGDSVIDIAVGAPFDNDGGIDRGAIWILFLSNEPVTTPTPQPDSTPTPSSSPTLTPSEGNGDGSGETGGGSGGNGGGSEGTGDGSGETGGGSGGNGGGSGGNGGGSEGTGDGSGGSSSPTPMPSGGNNGISPTPTPTPGPITQVISSLIVNPTSASRSTINFQTATVAVLNQNGQPMPGVDVLATTNGNRVIVTPIIATTDAEGIAEFMFRFKSFRANGVIKFVPLSSTATITQTKKMPTLRPVRSRPLSTVTTTSTSGPTEKAISSLIVSQTSTSRSVVKLQTATVTALDQNAQPVPGVDVLATISGNRVIVTPTIATTDAEGIAEFMFRFKSFRTNGVITFIPDNLTVSLKQTQKTRRRQR